MIRDEKGKFAKKTIEKENEIVEFYLSGDYFFQDVADKFGCSKGDVATALNRHNIKPKRRSHKKKLPAGTDEEIIEFYLTHNIHLVADKFNTSDEEIKKVLKRNGIKIRSKSESSRLSMENGRITRKIRYGDSYYTNTEKASQTKKNKSLEEKLNTYKKQQTAFKEKYNDENYNLTKAREVLADKYGPSMFLGTEECKQKTEEFAIENFGSLDDYNKYIRSLASQKLTELYGAPCGYLSDYSKEKAKSEEAKQKMYDTKKEHGTFTASKPEDDYYDMLISKFGIDNIERQYYDRERYKFRCDFYIKSLDLFIECNYHWTHDKKPYNPNDKDCINLVEYWKSKSNGDDYWSKAIEVYTDIDVRKVETAINNKLNYLMVYRDKTYFIKNGKFINKEIISE